MKRLIDALLVQQSPMIRALLGNLINALPPQPEIDRLFDEMLADLANGRDQVACDKLRLLLLQLGVSLDEYRDQH